MRKKERIDLFCDELKEIWKTNCPDWRFGQFIYNVILTKYGDPFFVEDEEMIKNIKKYFNMKE